MLARVHTQNRRPVNASIFTNISWSCSILAIAIYLPGSRITVLKKLIQFVNFYMQ